MRLVLATGFDALRVQCKIDIPRPQWQTLNQKSGRGPKTYLCL